MKTATLSYCVLTLGTFVSRLPFSNAEPASIDLASAILEKRQDSTSAMACLEKCTTSVDGGGCMDFQCFCTTQFFINSLTACTTRTCSSSDRALVAAAWAQFCAGVGASSFIPFPTSGANNTAITTPPSTRSGYTYSPGFTYTGFTPPPATTPGGQSGNSKQGDDDRESGPDTKILIAAIVPSVVAVIAVIVAVVLCMRRRKRRQLEGGGGGKVAGSGAFNPQMMQNHPPQQQTMSVYGAPAGNTPSFHPNALPPAQENQPYNPYQYQPVGQYPPPLPVQGLGLTHNESPGGTGVGDHSQMAQGYPADPQQARMSVVYSQQPQYPAQPQQLAPGPSSQNYPAGMQYSHHTGMLQPSTSSTQLSPTQTGLASPSAQSAVLPGYDSIWEDSTTSGSQSQAMSSTSPMVAKDPPPLKTMRWEGDADHGPPRGQFNVTNS